eukprot:Opistho-2@82883
MKATSHASATPASRKLEDCIAEYLDDTADLDADLREWQEIARTADQDAVVSLSGALNLSGNVASVRALSGLQLGRCLRQLSVQCSDSLNNWMSCVPANGSGDAGGASSDSGNDVPDIVHPDAAHDTGRHHAGLSITASLIDVIPRHGLGGSETVPPTPGVREFNPFLPQPDVQTGTDGQDDTASQAAAAKADEPLSIQYLRQAFSHLIESVTSALEAGAIDTARAAALEVMECYGSMDPVVTGAHVCLYQACCAYASLVDTFRIASRDGGAARERAIMNQIAVMAREHCDPHLNCSAFRGALETLSARNKAYGRIAVPPSIVESIVELLPPDFRVVVLQHSPDRKLLYGTVLWKKEEDRPLPSTSRSNQAQAAPQPTSPMDLLQAVAARIDVDPQAMDAVVRSFARFKFDVEKGMIRRHKESQLRKVHVPAAVVAVTTKVKKEVGKKKQQQQQQQQQQQHTSLSEDRPVDIDPLTGGPAAEAQPPVEFEEERSVEFSSVVA